jgi:hypothetical protein
MKQITVLILSLSLASCLQYEDKFTNKEDPPTCLQANRASTAIAPLPAPLPNLNVNPIYLEIRSHWRNSNTNPTTEFSRFRLYNSTQGIQAEIYVHNEDTNNKYMKCTQQINQADFDSLTQQINQAKMCTSISQSSNNCSLAMIAPSSLYVIDTNGPLTVNLHRFAYESTTSFCDMDEVEGLQESVSNLFPAILPNINCVETY